MDTLQFIIDFSAVIGSIGLVMMVGLIVYFVRQLLTSVE